MLGEPVHREGSKVEAPRWKAGAQVFVELGLNLVSILNSRINSDFYQNMVILPTIGVVQGSGKK